jgi:hypothetical protein
MEPLACHSACGRLRALLRRIRGRADGHGAMRPARRPWRTTLELVRSLRRSAQRFRRRGIGVRIAGTYVCRQKGVRLQHYPVDHHHRRRPPRARLFRARAAPLSRRTARPREAVSSVSPLPDKFLTKRGLRAPLSCFFEAAGQGLEPRLPDPESGVLPLDHPATGRGIVAAPAAVFRARPETILPSRRYTQPT